MFFKVHKSYLAKTTIVWTAMVLLCMSAYGLFLMPQNRKVQDLDRQFNLMDQQMRMSQAEGTPEAKSRLRNELLVTHNQIKEFAIDPVYSSSLSLNIGRLAGHAGVSGFSSKSTTNQPYRDIQNCERIGYQSIDVSFKGSFNHFATFLSSLERHQPVILIDRFRIIQSLRREQDHDVSMVLAVLINKKPGDIPLDLTLDSSDDHFGKSEEQSELELSVSVSVKEIVTVE